MPSFSATGILVHHFPIISGRIPYVKKCLAFSIQSSKNCSSLYLNTFNYCIYNKVSMQCIMAHMQLQLHLIVIRMASFSDHAPSLLSIQKPVLLSSGRLSLWQKASFMIHKLIFSHAAGTGLLPLVKDLYYSQEKGVSLLLKKRIRKTEEHAIHNSTNVVDSRYFTSS